MQIVVQAVQQPGDGRHFGILPGQLEEGASAAKRAFEVQGLLQTCASLATRLEARHLFEASS